MLSSLANLLTTSWAVILTWAEGIGSATRLAGLTVTMTSPASARPNCRITHSGLLAAHTATWSPGMTVAPTTGSDGAGGAAIRRRCHE